MEIKRFDNLEFSVLNCSASGMYSQNEDYKERALLLMKEKIIKKNPIKNWWKSGWKLTVAGQKYYDEFLAKVRANHGHEWETNHESNPDIYENNGYGKQINIFAYSVGFHNGPRCKKCGYKFCQHCDSEFDAPICSHK